MISSATSSTFSRNAPSRSPSSPNTASRKSTRRSISTAFSADKAGSRSRTSLALETLDCGASRVFAVADHQVAHIYLNDRALEPKVRAASRSGAGRRTGSGSRRRKRNGASGTGAAATSSPWPGRAIGSPTITGRTTRSRPISHARSIFIARSATTRRSFFSIPSCAGRSCASPRFCSGKSSGSAAC